MVQEGYDVNAQNDTGSTPLHFVARAPSMLINNYLTMAEYLISAGADPNIRNSTGKTSYQLAIEYGNAQIAEIFQKKMNRM